MSFCPVWLLVSDKNWHLTETSIILSKCSVFPVYFLWSLMRFDFQQKPGHTQCKNRDPSLYILFGFHLVLNSDFSFAHTPYTHSAFHLWVSSEVWWDFTSNWNPAHILAKILLVCVNWCLLRIGLWLKPLPYSVHTLVSHLCVSTGD